MSTLQIWLQNHNRKMNQEAIDEALMEYIGMVEKQRDDLLAALEGMLSLDADHQRGFDDEDVCYEVKQARAAIASVKSGAA